MKLIENRAKEGKFFKLLVYYRDIKGEKSLAKKTISTSREINDIENLIKRISDKTTSSYNMKDINISKNVKHWINSILNRKKNFNQYVEFIVNDFSDNMMTRAREEGKYAISLIFENKYIICHSKSGEDTLTKDLQVIERLLDLDNVDKYVEFQKFDQEIYVKHYEKYKSKSLMKWLGLFEKDSNFEFKGNINLFSSYDDLPIIFQFTRDELIERVIYNKDYSLENDILKTPSYEFPIEKIVWSGKAVQNTKTLINQVLQKYLQLDYYNSEYKKLIQKLPYFLGSEEIIDCEHEVLNKQDNRIIIRKNKPKSCIFFVNDKIMLDNKWLIKLSNAFISKQKEYSMYHAGIKISEKPIKIGNFLFFHIIPIDSRTLEYINQIYNIAVNTPKVELFKAILFYIVFFIVEQNCPSSIPLKYLFIAFKDYFLDKLKEKYNHGSRILTDEIERLMEFKSADWFVEKDNKTLVEKIGKELQKVAIIVGGIDEAGKIINPIQRTRFRSERLETLSKMLKKDFNNLSENLAIAIPLSNNDCLLCFTSFK